MTYSFHKEIKTISANSRNSRILDATNATMFEQTRAIFSTRAIIHQQLRDAVPRSASHIRVILLPHCFEDTYRQRFLYSRINGLAAIRLTPTFSFHPQEAS